MARPGFREHPKFRRAVYLLDEPEPLVYGRIEFVWHVSYQNGDACIGDEIDVELAAQWKGERGKLAKVFAEVRLLDVIDGKYYVHDLFDHCPEYVRTRSHKEAQRKQTKTCAACGTTYHSSEAHSKFCSDACRQANHRQKRRRKRNGA